MNKLLKGALVSTGALLIMGSVPSVYAAKGDQGVDWSIYQGSQGKFGYGHDKFAIAQIGGYYAGHGYVDQYTYPTQVQYAIAQGKRAHDYIFVDGVTDRATMKTVIDHYLAKSQTPQGAIFALDIEQGATNTDVVMYGLDYIQSKGKTAVLYGYKNFLMSNLDLQAIANKYPLWLAQYPNYEVTPEPNYNYFPSFDNVQLLQFTASYIAGGLDGNVDLTGITDNGYKHGNPEKPNTDTPAIIAGKEADNTPKADIAPGMTVKVNFSATHYAAGEAIPNYVKGEPHKVLEVDGDRVLLDDIYSWVNKKDVEILNASTQDDSAEFNGVFVLDSWQYELGGVYVRNNDMAIPVADYHNDMPAVSVTLTDRHGNPLTDQNGLGNNGVPEYFTLNGRYKVLQRVGSSIEVEMNGESVWLKSAFAN
ncbi:lysin [Weissella confusa]|uniref:Lysin n=2 Tax=Weissella confusa TaxID=1583 RepID=A0A923SNN7_WEICO|nr:GH25 family lysozyme [Weissella confusa]MBC6499295.1 lysin [Weissella confusa]MBJ7636422.1 lysin [Weissella confusa]MBS6377892.1 lysin [Weissella confusa]MCT8396288.1 lysin [Weissella confusa]TGE49873.1 lysin [Weissella confusa]